MSVNREVRRQESRTTVLDELDRMGEDRQPRDQTLLARFARCQDLQRSALTIARAVEAERRAHSATPLAPPTRMAAAPDLMASGSHFGVPHLDGIPGEYRFHAGEQASIRRARTLLELDLADPADWRRVRRDPTAYVQATLNRFIERHGGPVIRRRFNLTLTLSESADEYAETAEQDPDGRRLYLIVNPASAAYVVTGPTLALLEPENARLPMTFYRLFTSALNRWLRTYDYRDAEDRVEMLREWADGEEEQYEIADVAGCIPVCMKRKPLSVESLCRLRGRARGSEARP